MQEHERVLRPEACMRSERINGASTDGHAIADAKKLRIAAIYMVRYDSQ
jgi:hypothetical protein